jgi:hypothetical protein
MLKLKWHNFVMECSGHGGGDNTVKPLNCQSWRNFWIKAGFHLSHILFFAGFTLVFNY